MQPIAIKKIEDLRKKNSMSEEQFMNKLLKTQIDKYVTYTDKIVTEIFEFAGEISNENNLSVLDINTFDTSNKNILLDSVSTTKGKYGKSLLFVQYFWKDMIKLGNDYKQKYFTYSNIDIYYVKNIYEIANDYNLMLSIAMNSKIEKKVFKIIANNLKKLKLLRTAFIFNKNIPRQWFIKNKKHLS